MNVPASLLSTPHTPNTHLTFSKSYIHYCRYFHSLTFYKSSMK